MNRADHSKPLPLRLIEAAQWCSGEQMHTIYSDADYIKLFREASEQLSVSVELDFRWAPRPRIATMMECFFGKLRLGALWFDEHRGDEGMWCAAFSHGRMNESTFPTEAEAAGMIETLAAEMILGRRSP